MTGETWMILGAVFGAGGAWASMKSHVAKARSDVNGIGINQRRQERKLERRNKQLLSALIDTAKTDEDRKRFSKLLSDDSWDE